MERLTVGEIIVPVEEGVPLAPCVHSGNRITEALEAMAENDLKRIAVVDENVLVGMVRLEDALRHVGLDRTLRSKGSQSVVIHGRKIVVD